jgi:hypothetical protein
MDFKVFFIGIEVNDVIGKKLDMEYDISRVSNIMDSTKIGVKLLKRFNISANDIEQDHISYLSNSISLIIDEDIADNSGHFKEYNTLDVRISYDLLQNFVNIVYEDNKLVYKVDNKKLLQYWIDNNYKKLILSSQDKYKLEQRELKREEIKKKKELQKVEKEKREQEKIQWIKQHGSQYLKDCLELGQYAHREYLYERAKMEYPDYILDYEDGIRYNEIYSPSQIAIDELKKVRRNTENSDIVWLTNDGKERDWDDEDFCPCEAIIIRKWLGRYDLYRIID